MPKDLKPSFELANMGAMIHIQQSPDCPFTNPEASPQLTIAEASLTHRLIQR
jgi:hypothetical protein